MDFKIIPPDSFVIMKVPKIEEFMGSGEYEEQSEYFEKNNIEGIFMDPSADLFVLDDNELAKLGLQRRDKH